MFTIPRFVIAHKEEDLEVYWTCRAGDTNNFSCDVNEATVFTRREFAGATRKAIEIEDCYVKEV